LRDEDLADVRLVVDVVCALDDAGLVCFADGDVVTLCAAIAVFVAGFFAGVEVVADELLELC
jgi:hypothetical protein